MLTRNDQDMNRGFRMDVFKGDRLLVLVDNLPESFTISDLTKEAGVHAFVLSILRLALFSVALAQFQSHL